MLLQHVQGLGISLPHAFYQVAQTAAEFAAVGFVIPHVLFASDPIASPAGVAASHADVGTGCLVGFEEADAQFGAAALEGAGDGVGAFVDALFEVAVALHGFEGEEGSTVGTFGGVGRVGGCGGAVAHFLTQHAMEAGAAEASFAGGRTTSHWMVHVFKTNGTLKPLHILLRRRCGRRRFRCTKTPRSSIPRRGRRHLIRHRLRFQRRKHRRWHAHHEWWGWWHRYGLSIAKGGWWWCIHVECLYWHGSVVCCVSGVVVGSMMVIGVCVGWMWTLLWLRALLSAATTSGIIGIARPMNYPMYSHSWRLPLRLWL
mmetsp:Transcript_5614/g.12234  ORF Transcript_5614/g.12234 Transcript_5614/m.12234 type:complete len:314 (-) Transcript_5614:528-1469(-)